MRWDCSSSARVELFGLSCLADVCCEAVCLQGKKLGRGKEEKCVKSLRAEPTEARLKKFTFES